MIRKIFTATVQIPNNKSILPIELNKIIPHAY